MNNRLRDQYRKFKSSVEKRKHKIIKERQHELQKISLFNFFKKYQNYTIAKGGRIDSQINANFQLNDSEDFNVENVEVQFS
jgi:hypothetical protein